MADGRYREILIFVAGSTPQVITETIYALATGSTSVLPDDLYIITTAKGRELVEEQLAKGGVLEQLSQEYGLPRIEISAHSFIIPKDAGGTLLEDIRTEEENELMGDLITTFIMEKSADPALRLHCSLAGGRKTMSFYLGAALQLFGRPWDRLYHVLVSPEFEANPCFYYKPREHEVIECRMPDGSRKMMSTAEAEIRLAELPLIRLGRKLNLRSATFRQLVAEGQGEIETATIQPMLSLNLSERTLQIGDSLIEVVPMQLMICAAFLRQKKERCLYPDRPHCLECTDCFLSLQELSSRTVLEVMATDYDRIYGGRPYRKDELLGRWKEGMDPNVIRQNISKVNREIKEQLGDELLLPYYAVTTVKKYGDSRYGVRVEKGKIEVQ